MLVEIKITEQHPQMTKHAFKISHCTVMAVLDREKPSNLTEQECKALIDIMEMKNKLHDMELDAIYFRGCYDSVGYLKKAGIL